MGVNGSPGATGPMGAGFNLTPNMTPNMTAGPPGATGPMNQTPNMTIGPPGPTGPAGANGANGKVPVIDSKTGKQSTTLSVDSKQIMLAEVNAIKELNAIIEQQNATIQKQELRIAALEKKVGI